MPKTQDYKIRIGEAGDVLDIVFLGKKFVKESQNTHLGWDQDKAHDMAKMAVERDDFLVVVMEHEEEVVGFLVALVTPCFFSNKLQAVEMAWYVHKDHRGSGEALKMVDAYELWAREAGAILVNMINLDMLNGDKVKRIYEKKGYHLVENTFVKELN